MLQSLKGSKSGWRWVGECVWFWLKVYARMKEVLTDLDLFKVIGFGQKNDNEFEKIKSGTLIFDKNVSVDKKRLKSKSTLII